jgi:hypothetical protein
VPDSRRLEGGGPTAPVILEILDDRDRERLRDNPEPAALTGQVDRATDRRAH